MLGSSPLARGTPTRAVLISSRAGLIPARAGNTRPVHRYRHGNRAHPRSRGEHMLVDRINEAGEGSSPLARGTHHVIAFLKPGQGLIPARAGNTVARPVVRKSMRAHPRSRGEHSGSVLKLNGHSGSSPLARGTLGLLEFVEKLLGLIPARAGNTAEASASPSSSGAHPRSRGEHSFRFGSSVSSSGSSPLARGTRVRRFNLQNSAGLIPARAGNTPHGYCDFGELRAHPRSRGEHARNLWETIKTAGSSPLARGTQHAMAQNSSAMGLIPARAGNTRRIYPGGARAGAHPRSRGEH